MRIEEFLDRLDGVKRRGHQWEARCPSHDDRKASLSVAEGRDGSILVKCHAGCFTEDVLEAMSLTFGDLSPADMNGSQNGAYPAQIVYRYDDEKGEPLFEKVRTADKQFWQRLPGTKKGGLGDVRRVLYGLPELLKSRVGETVFIVEGEKDVENLRRLGFTATTNSEGASKPGFGSKWRDEYTDWLKENLPGREFVVIPDNDEAGVWTAQQVCESLDRAELPVKALVLPDLPPSGDVSDWIGAGGTREELLALVDSLNSLNSYPSQFVNSSVRSSVPKIASSEPDPPTGLAEEAFYGIAGQITRAVMPETESSEAAVLVSLLALFGSWLGRGPHASVGAGRHGLNLFACVVGKSAKARKGTGWTLARAILREIDPDYVNNHISTGLSSGEGLIYKIRDPDIRRKQLRDPKTKRLTMEFEEEVIDEGVRDKRLLVIQEELSSVLKVMTRSGNLLEDLLREAWDGNNLQLMTKNNPMKASDTHVSLMGHITLADLREHLVSTSAANGFGNRFLWVYSTRSKSLPEGGSNILSNISSIVSINRSKLTDARLIGNVSRDEKTRQVWAPLYDELLEERPGLYGAIVGRSEAQVLRLSALYAVLDGSRYIRLEHLFAACAVWDYCDQSARHIFGGTLGDPLLDDLHVGLKFAGENGMSMADIHHLTGRNHAAATLRGRLQRLEGACLARSEIKQMPNGRKAEYWFADQPAKLEPGYFLQRAKRLAQELER